MGCTTSLDAVSTGNQQQDVDLQLEQSKVRENRQGEQVNIYDVAEKREENDGSLFKADESESAEQFMAVKPWIGALVAPSNPKPLDKSAPTQKLQLEYVNGYRCEDSRQNLFFTKSPNEIVYMTAAIGVVMNIQENKQQFYGFGQITPVNTADGHNDDIEALDVDAARTTCVTGQRGQNPLICLWDIATCKTIKKMSLGRGMRAAKLVRFSKDGKYIFASDEHNDHNVHVFDLSGAKVGISKTGGDPIYDMDTSSGSLAGAIATKRGLQFIELNGGMISIKKGIFAGQQMIDQTSVCAFADGNRFASGAINGSLYVWQGNQCMKAVNIHQGAIHCVSFREGKLFTSGFGDKLLKVFNCDSMQMEQGIKLSSYARSIDMKDGRILVGTRDGQICTIENQQQNMIMNGHATGETWGLAVDETSGLVITTGDDNKIITFDPKQNKAIAQAIITDKPGIKKKIGGASTLSLFPPNQCARAVEVNPINGHVAIGTNEGELYIRKSLTEISVPIFFKQISAVGPNGWIEVVRYSPNGKLLAVGSHDSKIYILDVDQGYAQVAVCDKHRAFITSIDWSCDSQYIQSNCGAYEYLFFQASNGQQLTSGARQLKDEKWATFTCKLGWPVQGIFPPATDGSHVNGVDRSKSDLVFATGDDWGLVNLYRNPNNKGSICNSYRAHSSHVVRVQFDKNDAYLYSVGGYDRTLMKWKMV